MNEAKCPVCEAVVNGYSPDGSAHKFDCPTCGHYRITEIAIVAVQNHVLKNRKIIPFLSHAIRTQRQQQNGTVDSYFVGQIVEKPSLPNPREQADNLLRWAGETYESQPGESTIEIFYDQVKSVIGAVDAHGVIAIAKALRDKGLVAGDDAIGAGSISLTLDGWDAYKKLKNQLLAGPQAFMAMAFGNDELARLYRDHLVPAVAQTGFKLRRVDEKPRAGLVDNHLRDEIRQSRFLVSDLTDGNAGAYWEAGFADGIGIPVIYMCKQSVFQSRDNGTHFDTNHHHTVLWDPASPEAAVADLKRTIRGTLPDEARMTD